MKKPIFVLNCGSPSISWRTNEEWIAASHAERMLSAEIADVPQL